MRATVNIRNAHFARVSQAYRQQAYRQTRDYDGELLRDLSESGYEWVENKSTQRL